MVLLEAAEGKNHNPTGTSLDPACSTILFVEMDN